MMCCAVCCAVPATFTFLFVLAFFITPALDLDTRFDQFCFNESRSATAKQLVTADWLSKIASVQWWGHQLALSLLLLQQSQHSVLYSMQPAAIYKLHVTTLGDHTASLQH